MGLIDVLNGMRNGPRGQPDPNAKSGMSPITMAILGLIAYKAIQHLGTSQGRPAGGGGAMPTGGSSPGLGGSLAATLGGLLAGGGAGSIVSDGLNELIGHLQKNGLGGAANSWVGTGPNKAVDPNDLANALGADRIDALARQTGLSRDELLSGLAEQLPPAIDELTPAGAIPGRHDIDSMARSAGPNA